MNKNEEKEIRKSNLENLIQKNKLTPVYQPKTQKVVNTGKMGRPTDKNPQVHYVKLSVKVPFELREAIKLAMVTTHKHLGHKTQDSFVQNAIESYLKEKGN